MTDVRGARILRLINDPALGGDLLLVGVAMAAKYDFGLEYEGGFGGLAQMLWPDSVQPSWRIRRFLSLDIRTYKAPWPRNAGCSAPMLRREGACGKSVSLSGMATDWATGEKFFVGGCSRHRQWADDELRANYAKRPDLPPLPCANHGGALRVHFPRIDWVSFWRKLDPGWVEHPERAAWPKPDLTLVLGDDEDSGANSPLLSVVPSGGAS